MHVQFAGAEHVASLRCAGLLPGCVRAFVCARVRVCCTGGLNIVFACPCVGWGVGGKQLKDTYGKYTQLIVLLNSYFPLVVEATCFSLSLSEHAHAHSTSQSLSEHVHAHTQSHTHTLRGGQAPLPLTPVFVRVSPLSFCLPPSFRPSLFHSLQCFLPLLSSSLNPPPVSPALSLSLSPSCSSPASFSHTISA